MRRRGIIYHFSWGKRSGEIVVAISRGIRIAYHTARVLGSGLMVAGIAGVIFTFQPIVSNEIAFRLHQASGQNAEYVEQAKQVAQQLEAQAAEEEDRQKAVKLAAELGMPNSYFSIYIPKIDAKAPIIENVNAADSKAYRPALEKGVGHAAGSVFPGMEGATYLFAHSSDAPWQQAQYNTVFYLLRELEPGVNGNRGDEVYIFFLDKLYKYRVTEKHIVNANDVTWLTDARDGRERLILQTCWPPGTAIKRLIVVAEPEN
jgi:LPXTG-site transpeptidase (sortase) family protein